MSKPELDIIHSPSAETFLRSVTKGFYNQSYIALWMFEVIGREWDELREWSEGMRCEIHPQTCTWSIAVWEWVYGFEPDESLTLEERRRRVLSKVFGIKPVNPEAIRRGVSAVAGMDAAVTDCNPYGFIVTLLPDIETTPDRDILAAIQNGKILRYIREVKPAHLRVDLDIIVRVNAEPAVARTVCVPVSVSETVKSALALPVPMIKPTASIRTGAVTGLWESATASVELPFPIIQPTATARVGSVTGLYEGFTAGAELTTPPLRSAAVARLGAVAGRSEVFSADITIPDAGPVERKSKVRVDAATALVESRATGPIALPSTVLTATAHTNSKGAVASAQETARTQINL